MEPEKTTSSTPEPLKEINGVLISCPEKYRAKAEQVARAMKNEIDSRNGIPKTYSLSDFEIGCPLGRGKFGRVYLAREKKTKFIVALKSLFFSEMKKYKMTQQVLREIEINCNLQHPNILKMYTTFYTEKMIYLVLEYAVGGDLFSIQQRLKNNRLCQPQAAKYIYQVASALDYCHSKNVVHRDIKPENLLLNSQDNIKISDFGWSIHSRNKRKTMCGTLDYLPPEMVNRVSYDCSVDNWSVGILCFEFLSGNPPFESQNSEDTYRKIRKLDIRFPPFIPEGGKDLIVSLLKLNPSQRLSLPDTMKHYWIVQNKDIPYPNPHLPSV